MLGAAEGGEDAADAGEAEEGDEGSTAWAEVILAEEEIEEAAEWEGDEGLVDRDERRRISLSASSYIDLMSGLSQAGSSLLLRECDDDDVVVAIVLLPLLLLPCWCCMGAGALTAVLAL